MKNRHFGQGLQPALYPPGAFPPQIADFEPVLCRHRETFPERRDAAEELRALQEWGLRLENRANARQASRA